MNPTKKLIPIQDHLFKTLKTNWFTQSHPIIDNSSFVPLANEWFKSTRINNLYGWELFPCIDVVLGCTHFIESFILKYGWEGIQILEHEYAYYGLMGKHGTKLGNLRHNIPLIVSLPNWQEADVRNDWQAVLRECEIKNIDIHIDMAWLTAAQNIEIDLGHPNIKSFAMSLSKLSLEWNRIGLRWSKQRTMDSVTIFNHFHGDVNTALTSCGAYIINNIERDYLWNQYRSSHYRVCADLNLEPTKIIHVARNESSVVGISELILAHSST